MNVAQVPFNRRAIRPLECYRQGWNLIKGQYWLFFALSFVAMIIGSMVPMAILLGPMMCGLFLCFFKKADGQDVSFGTLFDGFSFFVDGLIASLLMMVPAFVLLLPAYLLSVVLLLVSVPASTRHASDSPAHFALRFLLAESPIVLALLLFGGIIAVTFSFVFPLIVRKKLKAIDAIVVSAKAGYANLGGLLGLVILNFLVSLVGLACCYVGAFFVLPVTFSTKFAAYRQVFGDTGG